VTITRFREKTSFCDRDLWRSTAPGCARQRARGKFPDTGRGASSDSGGQFARPVGRTTHEIEDRLQLLVAVVFQHLGKPYTNRAEHVLAVADPLEDGFDDNVAPISRIAYPAYQALFFEPVDQTGHRGRRQARVSSEFSGGDRTETDQGVDGLRIGCGQAGALGNRGMQHDRSRAALPSGREDALDQIPSPDDRGVLFSGSA